MSASAAPPCRTACYPDEVRDAKGCCAPRAGVSGKEAAGCPTGQEITDETAGRCCWPGQVWSGKACVGVPTRCPEGLMVEATAQRCAPKPCEGGRVRAQDEVHCCWPGQAWSTSRAMCVGVPESCPTGQAVAAIAQACLPIPACTGGLALTEDSLHCCWAGQKWADKCVGAPTCPAGRAANGEQCDPVPVCKGGLTLTPDSLHCCWAGQTWNGKACAGVPTCVAPLEARKEKCLPPLAPHVATILALTARSLACEKNSEDLLKIKRLEVRDCRLVVEKNWSNSDEQLCWYSTRVENSAELELDQATGVFVACTSTNGHCYAVIENERVFNFGLYLTANSFNDAWRIADAVRQAVIACGGESINVRTPTQNGR